MSTTQAPTTRKAAENIEPGDSIEITGPASMLLVATIEPYTHPTVEGAFAIARAANGSGISLWHGDIMRVWARP